MSTIYLPTVKLTRQFTAMNIGDPQTPKISPNHDHKRDDDETSDSSDSDSQDRSKFSPANLDLFMPWACRQLNMSRDVVVKRITIAEKVPPKASRHTASGHMQSSVTTLNQARKETTLKKENEAPSQISVRTTLLPNTLVNLETVYIANNKLVKLKFKNCRHVEAKIFKLIGLVIEFHPFLTTICINSGLDDAGVYELSKIIPNSNLTEIILDNCFVPSLNYYLLLNDPGQLTHLSLSNCQLNDEALKKICDSLGFFKKAGKIISLLNLSCNQITDKGANYIAECLRTNRVLKYLNLACNRITDSGADAILTSLEECELTIEQSEQIFRYDKEYFKKERNLISLSMTNLKVLNAMPSQKHRATKRSKAAKSNTYNHLFSQARKMATNMCASLERFPKSEMVCKNNKLLLHGNYVLCYLNLAYNELGFLTVQKILHVLQQQMSKRRMPSGLVKIVIEGNPLPTCQELNEISRLLTLKQNALMPNKLLDSLRKSFCVTK